MTTNPSTNLPIGYWLKEVDRLLTMQIDQLQQVNGVTRTSWQLLNLLQEQGAATQAHLAATLRPFAAAERIDALLSTLVAQGWVAPTAAIDHAAPCYQLTPVGQQQHAAILATQQTVRSQLMQGISTAEYATVVRVLQQMVANLQAPPPETGGV